MRRRFKSVYSIRYLVYRRAQSLLEVVIAMAIAAILAISVISTILITQKSNKSADNNTRATKLVQDGVEKMRIFRDRNPNGYDGLGLVTGPCLWLDSSDSNPSLWSIKNTSQCPEEKDLGDKKFFRRVTIGPDSGGQRLVIVSVTWDESGGVQKVENETYLSKGY